MLMADVLRLLNRFDGLAEYPAWREYARCRPAIGSIRRPCRHFAPSGPRAAQQSVTVAVITIDA